MNDALESSASTEAAQLDLSDLVQPDTSRPRLIGDYELHKELGQGGMGTVYQAYQRSLRRMVALKMMNRARVSGQAGFLRRFRIEAEAIAALKHENIVEIHEAGEHEGQPYFSMELIEGGDLRQKIQEQGGHPLPLRRAVELVAAIARAVHHAHERGIFHRDLKPGNILLDTKGKPYVTDFGLARVFQQCAEPDGVMAGASGGSSESTEVGQGMGSPGYTSAEQAEGRTSELTTASDVFSVGAILYHLITGQAPLPTRSWSEGDNWEIYVRMARAGAFQKPSARNPQVDADLEAICLRCLEPDPKHRASSAADLANQLEHWLRREPLDAGWRQTPVWERAGKWVRRHPVETGLGVSVLAGLLLMVGVMYFRHRVDEEALQVRLSAAESHLLPGDASEGLADFALLLRQRPDQRIAAERIINTLWQRVFLLPTSPTNFSGQTTVSAGKFAIDELSPDRKLRLAVISNISIAVFDATSGASVWSIPRAHRLVIRDLRWSSDSRRFVSASADGDAVIWDTMTKTSLPPFAHPGAVYHADLDNSGTKLVTACADTFARVWNVANHSLIAQPISHPNRVGSARFNADASLIVTVSDDGTVRVWESRSGSPYSEPLRLDGPGDARFTRDSRSVEVAFANNTSRLFKAASAFGRSIPEASFGVSRHTFVPVTEAKNARAVISGNTVELRKVHGGRTIFLVHESTVNCVCFSPDERRVATSTAGKRARVWDAWTGQPLTDWLDSPEPVAEVRFSADGARLFSDNDCWEIHSATGPAPEWMADLAEAVAGEKTESSHRISGRGSAEKLARVRNALGRLPATNQLIVWAKEYVSDASGTPQR